MLSEVSILRAVVDLATASAPAPESPVKFSSSRAASYLPRGQTLGPADYYITFGDIIQAFNKVCAESEMDRVTEQRIYQALLLMSSDTEGEQTWFEKAQHPETYFPEYSKRALNKRLPSDSSPLRATGASSSLPLPPNRLMSSQFSQLGSPAVELSYRREESGHLASPPGVISHAQMSYNHRYRSPSPPGRPSPYMGNSFVSEGRVSGFRSSSHSNSSSGHIQQDLSPFNGGDYSILNMTGSRGGMMHSYRTTGGVPLNPAAADQAALMSRSQHRQASPASMAQTYNSQHVSELDEQSSPPFNYSGNFEVVSGRMFVEDRNRDLERYQYLGLTPTGVVPPPAPAPVPAPLPLAAHYAAGDEGLELSSLLNADNINSLSRTRLNVTQEEARMRIRELQQSNGHFTLSDDPRGNSGYDYANTHNYTDHFGNNAAAVARSRGIHAGTTVDGSRYNFHTDSPSLPQPQLQREVDTSSSHPYAYYPRTPLGANLRMSDLDPNTEGKTLFTGDGGGGESEYVHSMPTPALSAVQSRVPRNISPDRRAPNVSDGLRNGYVQPTGTDYLMQGPLSAHARAHASVLGRASNVSQTAELAFANPYPNLTPKEMLALKRKEGLVEQAAPVQAVPKQQFEMPAIILPSAPARQTMIGILGNLTPGIAAIRIQRWYKEMFKRQLQAVQSRSGTPADYQADSPTNFASVMHHISHTEEHASSLHLTHNVKTPQNDAKEPLLQAVPVISPVLQLTNKSTTPFNIFSDEREHVSPDSHDQVSMALSLFGAIKDTDDMLGEVTDDEKALSENDSDEEYVDDFEVDKSDHNDDKDKDGAGEPAAGGGSGHSSAGSGADTSSNRRNDKSDKGGSVYSDGNDEGAKNGSGAHGGTENNETLTKTVPENTDEFIESIAVLQAKLAAEKEKTKANLLQAAALRRHAEARAKQKQRTEEHIRHLKEEQEKHLAEEHQKILQVTEELRSQAQRETRERDEKAATLLAARLAEVAEHERVIKEHEEVMVKAAKEKELARKGSLRFIQIAQKRKEETLRKDEKLIHDADIAAERAKMIAEKKKEAELARQLIELQEAQAALKVKHDEEERIHLEEERQLKEEVRRKDAEREAAHAAELKRAKEETAALFSQLEVQHLKEQQEQAKAEAERIHREHEESVHALLRADEEKAAAMALAWKREKREIVDAAAAKLAEQHRIALEHEQDVIKKEEELRLHVEQEKKVQASVFSAVSKLRAKHALAKDEEEKELHETLMQREEEKIAQEVAKRQALENEMEALQDRLEKSRLEAEALANHKIEEVFMETKMLQIRVQEAEEHAKELENHEQELLRQLELTKQARIASDRKQKISLAFLASVRKAKADAATEHDRQELESKVREEEVKTEEERLRVEEAEAQLRVLERRMHDMQLAAHVHELNVQAAQEVERLRTQQIMQKKDEDIRKELMRAAEKNKADLEALQKKHKEQEQALHAHAAKREETVKTSLAFISKLRLKKAQSKTAHQREAHDVEIAAEQARIDEAEKQRIKMKADMDKMTEQLETTRREAEAYLAEERHRAVELLAKEVAGHQTMMQAKEAEMRQMLAAQTKIRRDSLASMIQSSFAAENVKMQTEFAKQKAAAEAELKGMQHHMDKLAQASEDHLLEERRLVAESLVREEKKHKLVLQEKEHELRVHTQVEEVRLLQSNNIISKLKAKRASASNLLEREKHESQIEQEDIRAKADAAKREALETEASELHEKIAKAREAAEIHAQEEEKVKAMKLFKDVEKYVEQFNDKASEIRRHASYYQSQVVTAMKSIKKFKDLQEKASVEADRITHAKSIQLEEIKIKEIIDTRKSREDELHGILQKLGLGVNRLEPHFEEVRTRITKDLQVQREKNAAIVAAKEEALLTFIRNDAESSNQLGPTSPRKQIADNAVDKASIKQQKLEEEVKKLLDQMAEKTLRVKLHMHALQKIVSHANVQEELCIQDEKQLAADRFLEEADINVLMLQLRTQALNAEAERGRKDLRRSLIMIANLKGKSKNDVNEEDEIEHVRQLKAEENKIKAEEEREKDRRRDIPELLSRIESINFQAEAHARNERERVQQSLLNAVKRFKRLYADEDSSEEESSAKDEELSDMRAQCRVHIAQIAKKVDDMRTQAEEIIMMERRLGWERVAQQAEYHTSTLRDQIKDVHRKGEACQSKIVTSRTAIANLQAQRASTVQSEEAEGACAKAIGDINLKIKHEISGRRIAEDELNALRLQLETLRKKAAEALEIEKKRTEESIKAEEAKHEKNAAEKEEALQIVLEEDDTRIARSVAAIVKFKEMDDVQKIHEAEREQIKQQIAKEEAKIAAEVQRSEDAHKEVDELFIHLAKLREQHDAHLNTMQIKYDAMNLAAEECIKEVKALMQDRFHRESEEHTRWIKEKEDELREHVAREERQRTASMKVLMKLKESKATTKFEIERQTIDQEIRREEALLEAEASKRKAAETELKSLKVKMKEAQLQSENELQQERQKTSLRLQAEAQKHAEWLAKREKEILQEEEQSQKRRQASQQFLSKLSTMKDKIANGALNAAHDRLLQKQEADLLAEAERRKKLEGDLEKARAHLSGIVKQSEEHLRDEQARLASKLAWDSEQHERHIQEKEAELMHDLSKCVEKEEVLRASIADMKAKLPASASTSERLNTERSIHSDEAELLSVTTKRQGMEHELVELARDHNLSVAQSEDHLKTMQAAIDQVRTHAADMLNRKKMQQLEHEEDIKRRVAQEAKQQGRSRDFITKLRLAQEKGKHVAEVKAHEVHEAVVEAELRAARIEAEKAKAEMQAMQDAMDEMKLANLEPKPETTGEEKVSLLSPEPHPHGHKINMHKAHPHIALHEGNNHRHHAHHKASPFTPHVGNANIHSEASTPGVRTPYFGEATPSSNQEMSSSMTRLSNIAMTGSGRKKVTYSAQPSPVSKVMYDARAWARRSGAHEREIESKTRTADLALIHSDHSFAEDIHSNKHAIAAALSLLERWLAMRRVIQREHQESNLQKRKKSRHGKDASKDTAGSSLSMRLRQSSANDGAENGGENSDSDGDHFKGLTADGEEKYDWDVDHDMIADDINKVKKKDLDEKEKDYDLHSCSAAIILYAHMSSDNVKKKISCQTDFERWLRAKMTEICIVRALEDVYHAWALHTNVAQVHQARLHSLKSIERHGFIHLTAHILKPRLRIKMINRFKEPKFVFQVDLAEDCTTQKASPQRTTSRALDKQVRGLFEKHGDTPDKSPLLGDMKTPVPAHPMSRIYYHVHSVDGEVDASPHISLNHRVQSRSPYSGKSLTRAEIVDAPVHAVNPLSLTATYKRFSSAKFYTIALIGHHESQVANQSLLSMLFYMRRFYKRTFHVSRTNKVKQLMSQSMQKRTFKFLHTRQTSLAAAHEVLISKAELLCEAKLQRAFRKAYKCIKSLKGLNLRQTNQLQRLNVRINLNPSALRAMHLIRCASFVKFFLAIKEHYEWAEITYDEIKRSERHSYLYALRTRLHRWVQWKRQMSHQRVNAKNYKYFRYEILKKRVSARTEQMKDHLMAGKGHSEVYIKALIHRTFRASFMDFDKFSRTFHTDKHGQNVASNVTSLTTLSPVRITVSECVQSTERVWLTYALSRLWEWAACRRVYFSLSDVVHSQCSTAEKRHRRGSELISAAAASAVHYDNISSIKFRPLHTRSPNTTWSRSREKSAWLAPGSFLMREFDVNVAEPVDTIELEKFASESTEGHASSAQKALIRADLELSYQHAIEIAQKYQANALPNLSSKKFRNIVSFDPDGELFNLSIKPVNPNLVMMVKEGSAGLIVTSEEAFTRLVGGHDVNNVARSEADKLHQASRLLNLRRGVVRAKTKLDDMHSSSHMVGVFRNMKPPSFIPGGELTLDNHSEWGEGEGVLTTVLTTTHSNQTITKRFSILASGPIVLLYTRRWVINTRVTKRLRALSMILKTKRASKLIQNYWQVLYGEFISNVWRRKFMKVTNFPMLRDRAGVLSAMRDAMASAKLTRKLMHMREFLGRVTAMSYDKLVECRKFISAIRHKVFMVLRHKEYIPEHEVSFGESLDIKRYTCTVVPTKEETEEERYMRYLKHRVLFIFYQSCGNRQGSEYSALENTFLGHHDDETGFIVRHLTIKTALLVSKAIDRHSRIRVLFNRLRRHAIRSQRLKRVLEPLYLHKQKETMQWFKHCVVVRHKHVKIQQYRVFRLDKVQLIVSHRIMNNALKFIKKWMRAKRFLVLRTLRKVFSEMRKYIVHERRAFLKHRPFMRFCKYVRGHIQRRIIGEREFIRGEQRRVVFSFRFMCRPPTLRFKHVLLNIAAKLYKHPICKAFFHTEHLGILYGHLLQHNRRSDSLPQYDFTHDKSQAKRGELLRCISKESLCCERIYWLSRDDDATLKDICMTAKEVIDRRLKSHGASAIPGAAYAVQSTTHVVRPNQGPDHTFVYSSGLALASVRKEAAILAFQLGEIGEAYINANYMGRCLYRWTFRHRYRSELKHRVEYSHPHSVKQRYALSNLAVFAVTRAAIRSNAHKMQYLRVFVKIEEMQRRVVDETDIAELADKYHNEQRLRVMFKNLGRNTSRRLLRKQHMEKAVRYRKLWIESVIRLMLTKWNRRAVNGTRSKRRVRSAVVYQEARGLSLALWLLRAAAANRPSFNLPASHINKIHYTYQERDEYDFGYGKKVTFGAGLSKREMRAEQRKREREKSFRTPDKNRQQDQTESVPRNRPNFLALSIMRSPNLK